MSRRRVRYVTTRYKVYRFVCAKDDTDAAPAPRLSDTAGRGVRAMNRPVMTNSSCYMIVFAPRARAAGQSLLVCSPTGLLTKTV